MLLQKTKQISQIIEIQTKLAVGKHSRERLHTVIRQFTVLYLQWHLLSSGCVKEGANAVLIIKTVILIIVIWANVHVQDQKSPLQCLQMCVTGFSRIPTQPLLSFCFPLRAPQVPWQVPRHQRNAFFSVKKGCLNTVLLHCELSVTVCPALLAIKAFLLEWSRIVTGRKGGDALGALGSTDDLLFDRFCCQHWWWLMLIPNSTVVSLNVFFIDICTVVCFCCQYYFHSQSGWRFQRLTFLNGLQDILEGVQWPPGSFNECYLQGTCDTQLRERDYGRGSNGKLRIVRERLHSRDLGS